MRTASKQRISAWLTIVLATTSFSAFTQPRQVWPTAGWTKATPETQGISAARFTELDRDIQSGAYGNIDRVLVVRGGYLVVDERYARDYRAISRGHKGPLGCGEGCSDPAAMNEFNYFHPNWHPYYQGRDIHTLQSVTKSIAATVVGIALGQKKIASVEVPFLSFFKDRDLSRVDARLHKATLQDLLTMRSGIEWHESDRPLDETNTTYQLEKSKDWIRFTLDQPMDAAPGTKWVYNSGGSQLLSGIIRTTTGRFIDDYATETLFHPLGIREFHWKKTPTGHPDTEGGLYLSAEDLAKIGLLYLRDGKWEGNRILPEGWVREATTRHATALPGGWAYGYQWWLTTRGDAEVWAGRGFGGQFLIVIPSRDIVGVVQSWNVFGGKSRPIFEPFLTALMESDSK
jgi:CubicO group peptidase (beta-lactamase class C family)